MTTTTPTTATSMTIPSLPTELLAKIVSYLPTSTTPELRTLAQLCLTSQTFLAIAQPLLYLTPTLVDAPYPSSFLLLQRTLSTVPALGGMVRALRLRATHWETIDMELLMGIVGAVKDGLEELELRELDCFGIGDLLALPRNLKLLYLSNCTISSPFTSQATLPSSSILHLSVTSCTFDSASLPASHFEALVSLSLSGTNHLAGDLSLLAYHLGTLLALRYFVDSDQVGGWSSSLSPLFLCKKLKVLEIARTHIPNLQERFLHPLFLLPSKLDALRVTDSTFGQSVVFDLLSCSPALTSLRKVEVVDPRNVRYAGKESAARNLEELCRQREIELHVETQDDRGGPNTFFAFAGVTTFLNGCI